MSGNRESGLKAKETIYDKYGSDFFRKMGAKGGAKKVPKGFGVNRELARSAGRIGGTKSRRTKK